MILYYGIDREILNSNDIYSKSRSIIIEIEKSIENELKNLIFIMPMDEQVVISTTFRFESDMCRKILWHNHEFAEKGYLVQYMKEDSEREFQEKKAERYQSAMPICEDYRIAYLEKGTYEKVNGLWMQTIHKTESVGNSSRQLFTREIRRIGANKNIPLKIVEEVLKIINDISDEVFLWEVVEHELLKYDIPLKIIRDLQIRQKMNKSYLTVFGNQNIQIPYNSVIHCGTLVQDSIYNMWKIKAILSSLEIESLINEASASEIIKLHESQTVQELLQIIRKGLDSREEILPICQKVQQKANIRTVILSVLNGGEESKVNDSYCENLRKDTLKLLHLSDLHLTDEKSMESNYFYLSIDLKKQFNLSKLDYLLISGDICNLPIETQYKVAVNFVQKLISEFKLDLKKVIIVVGNHDCNRQISKDAYDVATGTFCEDKREKRFQPYNEFFYRPLFGRDYPTEYDQQIERLKDDKHKIYIVGFNSSYQIDHIEKEKSGICVEAIRNDGVGVALGDEYIKLVTWHHPISGNGGIADRTFLDTLVVLRYKACFHGHIHEAAKESYGYDDRYDLKMIGAGSLGASKKDREDGIPLQYNLIEIDTKSRKLIVHTRKREKENGIWMADARWGDKSHSPKAYYIVNV